LSVITNTFRPLLGLPCWGVRFDGNTGLWLQFGPPHLRIRQPRPNLAKFTGTVRRILSKRLITVSGRWTLSISCGRWRLKPRRGRAVSGRSTYERIQATIAELDGQQLTQATVDPQSGATRLTFDLGALLEVAGSDCEDGEIWTLYKPRAYALSIRSSGEYSHGSASAQLTWRPLQKGSHLTSA
jgi:hypothetical protein